MNVLDYDFVENAKLTKSILQNVGFYEVVDALHEQSSSRSWIRDFRKLIEIFINPGRSTMNVMFDQLGESTSAIERD